MRSSKLLLTLASCSSLFGATRAEAAPALRTQATQHGDFVMISNAGGFECGPGSNTPAPVVGTATCNTTNITDSAPDIFWRSQDPTDAQARADGAVTSAASRTSAMLALPANATVTFARVYWAGYLATGTAVDTTLSIDRPGSTLLPQAIVADRSNQATRGQGFFWYQSTADITTLVQGAGAGLYRVSDIGSVELPGLQNDDPIDAWSIVVFYTLSSDPSRNLALFDGLDLVLPGNTVSATLSGFLVPNSGFAGKLGLIAYEGRKLARRRCAPVQRHNSVEPFESG